MTPKEALTNIAIAMVENFVGKDEPRRTEQINRFLNSNECQIIEQALTEHEKQTQILEVLKKCFWELDLINEARDYKQYSGWFEVRCGTPTLTETEFNLIKEWLNNGK